ncbi:MAG: type II secretion system F family protein [Candidatus Altiarchaeota archaeon]
MKSIFESPVVLKMSEPLLEYAYRLEVLFPQMEWNLKRAGYTLESSQYLAVAIYLSVTVFTFCVPILVLPVLFTQGIAASYASIIYSIIISAAVLVYVMMLPSVRMKSRAVTIDRDLEYLLKDMRIQLTAGVPLFDTIVNVAKGGYGECSKIFEGVIQEVEQGRSIVDVLDDVGMWSSSEYFRRMLWQIVNALKSGSDIANALDALSNDIRLEKENRIRAYGKELNLYGLIYLMFAIIVPSMGVTLLVILSSFLGGKMINETLFWMILIGVALFQTIFIVYVRSKRPLV